MQTAQAKGLPHLSASANLHSPGQQLFNQPALSGFLRHSQELSLKLEPHVAASFRTAASPQTGMSAFPVPAQITPRNAREFVKLCHSNTLQMPMLMSRTRDEKTAGVSGTVWCATCVLISCIFTFAFDVFWPHYTLQHIWKSVWLYRRYTSTLRYTLTHTQLCVHVPPHALTNSPRDRVISCPHLFKQFEGLRAETKLEILH